MTYRRMQRAPAIITDGDLLDNSPKPKAEEKETTTYAQCSKCKAVYTIDTDRFGRGKKLTCVVCNHGWWQTTDRLQTLRQGFELKDFPDSKIETVKENLASGRGALEQKKAAITLFVGNVPYDYDENDIKDVFGPIGSVASVALVKRETGESKGFCFVSYEKKEDGEKAIEELNGLEIDGRFLNVALGKNDR